MKNNLLLLLSGCILLGITSCESEQEPAPVDCNATDLSLMTQNVTDASGCGDPNGSIAVNATGGTSPYQFKIGSADFQATGTFEDLAAGNYTLTVKDAAGCEDAVMVQVNTQNSSLAFTEVSSTDAGCNTANATITVTASGEGTIQYKIDDGSFQPDNTFQNIAAGPHQVTITDDSGCESVNEVQIMSGTSFQSHIKPIITNNCAVSNCHDGSNSNLPNFNVFANVKSKASQIKTRTQDGSMPPGGRTITQEQKDLIACWVDDGALDN